LFAAVQGDPPVPALKKLTLICSTRTATHC